MRKCLRCETEMVENLDVKVEGGAYGIKITEIGRETFFACQSLLSANLENCFLLIIRIVT